MRFMKSTSVRYAVAVVAVSASALLTTGTSVAAAAGNYCDYVDGTVYCGVEENIVEGDPRLGACIARWERASMACPPGLMTVWTPD